MAVKRYEAIAVTGEYTNSFGETKKRYHRCGIVFENERGLSLKLEALPVGAEWNGWMFFAEPRPSEQTAQSRENPPRGGGGGYNAPAPREQSQEQPPRGGGGYNAPAPREQAPAEDFDDEIPFITSAGIW